MANTNEPDKPNYRRPESVAAMADLTLISDLLGGTRVMWDKSVERKYIRKWTDEKPEVYTIRRQCETLFEGLARVLSAAVGMLWQKMPQLDWNQSEDAMEEHWANLDGAGAAGPVLCKRFSDQSVRDGIGLILVDHPAPPKEADVITDKMAQDFLLAPFVWQRLVRKVLIGDAGYPFGELGNDVGQFCNYVFHLFRILLITIRRWGRSEKLRSSHPASAAGVHCAFRRARRKRERLPSSREAAKLFAI